LLYAQQLPAPTNRWRVFHHATASHADEITWLLPVIRAVLEQAPHVDFEIVGDVTTLGLYRKLPRTTVVYTMSWQAYQHFVTWPGRHIGLAPFLPSLTQDHQRLNQNRRKPNIRMNKPYSKTTLGTAPETSNPASGMPAQEGSPGSLPMISRQITPKKKLTVCRRSRRFTDTSIDAGSVIVKVTRINVVVEDTGDAMTGLRLLTPMNSFFCQRLQHS